MGASRYLGEATVFAAEHAEAAGNLISKTRPLGWSLGDRACLTLGIVLRAPVYTADKSRKKLKLGAPIHLVRAPLRYGKLNTQPGGGYSTGLLPGAPSERQNSAPEVRLWEVMT
jgi:hypothetical protein